MRRRVAKTSAVTITSPTFVDTDGESPADCTSLPTCAVAREDGTSLTAAVVTNQSDPGVYTAAITTTHTSQLDRLTITWTGTVSGQQQVYTDEVEVVGGHLVAIPEIRAEPNLSDATKYPTALLLAVRDEFAELAETYCGIGFVRRYQRDRLDGDGTTKLILSRLYPRSLISVTVNGTSETTTEFDLHDRGSITWRNDSFPRPDNTNGARNCAIAYEHAYTDTAPPDLRREALRWIRRELLLRTAETPNDRLSETFDGLTVRYSTADFGAGRPTGMVSVDAVLNRYRHTGYGFA